MACKRPGVQAASTAVAEVVLLTDLHRIGGLLHVAPRADTPLGADPVGIIATVSWTDLATSAECQRACWLVGAERPSWRQTIVGRLRGDEA